MDLKTDGIVVFGEPGDVLAVCVNRDTSKATCGVSSKQTAEQQVANAKLFAAAPDLLDALRDVTTETGAPAARSHAYALRRLEEINRIANAAIAKATAH